MTKKVKISHKYNQKMIIILTAVVAIVGAGLLIFTKAATGTASLYLTPSSGSYNNGSNMTIGVYLNTSDAINTVSALVAYDTTKLDYVSTDLTGATFTSCLTGPAASGAANGVVQINCGISGSSATGNNLKIATITFRAKVGTGTTSLSFTTNSEVDKGNGVNVWNGVTTGGTYSLVTPDTTAPVITNGAPANGTTVNGTVAVNATITDDRGTVSSATLTIDSAAPVAMTAGTGGAYSYSWNTGSVADGTHTLLITAKDPANNTSTSSRTVTVQNAKPNLSVSSLTVSPSVITPGTVVTITAMVTNNGSLALPSGSSVATAFKVDATTISSPTDTTALAIGATRTVTSSWTATLGSHTIYATADASSVVVESNESDNVTSKALTVYKLGDANGDGNISAGDFSIINNNWGVTNATLAMGDVSGDGKVGAADFSILNNNWGL